MKCRTRKCYSVSRLRLSNCTHVSLRTTFANFSTLPDIVPRLDTSSMGEFWNEGRYLKRRDGISQKLVPYIANKFYTRFLVSPIYFTALFPSARPFTFYFHFSLHLILIFLSHPPHHRSFLTFLFQCICILLPSAASAFSSHNYRPLSLHSSCTSPLPSASQTYFCSTFSFIYSPLFAELPGTFFLFTVYPCVCWFSVPPESLNFFKLPLQRKTNTRKGINILDIFPVKRNVEFKANVSVRNIVSNTAAGGVWFRKSFVINEKLEQKYYAVTIFNVEWSLLRDDTYY